MNPTVKRCMLVVDDEPDVCDSVKNLLRHDFEVLVAHSAEEGYRVLQEREVHVIMTDQRMPQVTGVEFLSRVRTRHPQAIRMLFTGFSDIDSIVSAINQGHVYRFLTKPWEPEDLLSSVREAAVEYDRLVATVDENLALRAEVEGLKGRVTALETEVERLSSPTLSRAGVV